jgi:outer membrane receptor protein involved in Fe transport
MTLNSQPLDGWDLTWGLDADHETFNANQMFFDLGQSMASGGLNNEAIYTTGRYPGYSITNLAPFLQSSYDLNDIFTLSGGVRYQWTENRVDDFVGYAQQQDVASGKVRSADAIRAVKPITITSCLTPGLSPISPTVSRPGLTSRRALSCRIRVNTTASANTARRSTAICRCSQASTSVIRRCRDQS